MQWSGNKERIISVITALSRRVGYKTLLFSGLGFLLLAAFVAGGIFMSSAAAAGSEQKPQGKGQRAGEASMSKVELKVTSISGQTISGKTGDGTLNIVTNASTSFSREGVAANLSAVTVGETIGAYGTVNSDGSITAQHVEIFVPGDKNGDKNKVDHDPGILGKISGINGTTITIQKDGKSVSVKTLAGTTFGSKVVGKEIALSDFKVGDTVHVAGSANSDGSFNAREVVVVPAGTGDAGTGDKKK